MKKRSSKKINYFFIGTFTLSILFLCLRIFHHVLPMKTDISNKEFTITESTSTEDTSSKNANNKNKSTESTFIQANEDASKTTIEYTSVPKTNTNKKTKLLSRKDLRKLSAGTVIDITKIEGKSQETAFYYEKIKNDIKLRINGKSYGKDCTVPYGDLRYVRVLYYGFDEETHIGEIIVNKAIAKDTLEIFKELYNEKYPIEQMVLVDEYDADDEASMAANNTSSFNYRSIAGSTTLSKHALGLAIDINPLYNPYVKLTKKGTVVSPEEGLEYADRSLNCPYYIKKNDICYKIFINHGFTWGGSWRNKDYQHFEKSIK